MEVVDVGKEGRGGCDGVKWGVLINVMGRPMLHVSVAVRCGRQS